MLGEQYQRDFELFHYVEQEENTRLLKQKEKDRQCQIAHLFDISDIQKKISNINLASTKIGKLCNSQKYAALNQLRDKWESAKQKLLPVGNSVAYEKMIKITNQPWDRDVVEVDAQQFEQWLSADGELFRIRRFIENFEHYENYLYNNEFLKKLLPKQELQQRFLMFYLSLEQRNKWQDEVTCFESASALSDAFKDTIKAISEDRLAITAPLFTLLPETILPEKFHEQVAGLKLKLASANKVQECYANLLQTREQMISVFKEHQSHCDLTNICPTCGHLWPTADELFRGIENQRITLELLAEQQNDQFSQALANFRRDWQEPVEAALRTYIEQKKEGIERKRQLMTLSEEQIQWLENYYKQLVAAGINLQGLLSENFEPVTQHAIDELEGRIRERIRRVDDSRIHDDFERIFREVFNNDLLVVKSVTIQKIESKKII